MVGHKALHPATIAKLEADRERLLAGAEQAKAQAAFEKARARKEIAAAEIKELQLVSRRRAEAAYQATDLENHVLQFTDEVESGSVAEAIGKLSKWSRLDPKCDIEIVLNSPGGDVIYGMYLFDFIQRLRRQKHKVTTVAMGHAASMAGILLQAGDVRVMAKESWLLIHQGSILTMGSMGKVEDTVAWAQEVEKRIVNIFYDRSNATDAPKKLAKPAIKKRMERKDWWLSSDQALSHGFIDEVW